MKKWQSYLGFCISFIFLYLVIFQPRLSAWLNHEIPLLQALFGQMRFNARDLESAIEMIHPLPFLLAFVLLVGSLLLRAWRWQQMIQEVGPARFSSVFWSNNLGYLLNNILPFRAGEVIRAIVVGQSAGLSKVSMFSVVVLERIIDLAGLAVLFGIVLALYPFPYWLRLGGAVLAFIIALVLVTAVILSRFHEAVADWINKRTGDKTGLFQKIGALTISTFDGLSVLRSRRAILNIIWSSIGLWMIYITVMKLALDSFSFTDGRFPEFSGGGWIPAAVLTVMTTLGLAIPSAPAAVGTYHGVTVLTLSWFHIPQAVAIVFATTMHLFMVGTLSIMGLIGMWQLGLSWKMLLKNVREEQRTT